MRSDAAVTDHVRTEPSRRTTVDVRCTGHVRTEIGEHSFEYAFEGSTLREFLDAFFEEYGVADMLIAETEDEARTEGWAPTDGDPPGSWEKTRRENRPVRSPASRSTGSSTNTWTDSTPNSRTATGSR
jgi:hypothetical protein